MLLDLKYGMLGQVFVDFGDDPLLHIRVECKPQISQRSRRGDHNEYLNLTLAHQSFHCCRNSLSEAVLFQLVPIGIFNAAAEVGAGALEGAARSIAALLVRWRIVIDEHALDLEIRRLLVACIAQEQRLAAVTDEYKKRLQSATMICRSLWLIHRFACGRV
jgi:hypothetical protein